MNTKSTSSAPPGLCLPFRDMVFISGASAFPARFSQSGPGVVLRGTRSEGCSRFCCDVSDGRRQFSSAAPFPLQPCGRFFKFFFEPDGRRLLQLGAGEPSAQLNFGHINQTHISSHQPACLSAAARHARIMSSGGCAQRGHCVFRKAAG